MWPLIWLKNGSLFQVTLRSKKKKNNAINNSRVYGLIRETRCHQLGIIITIFINDKGPFPYVRTILVISFPFMLFKDRDSDLLSYDFFLYL